MRNAGGARLVTVVLVLASCGGAPDDTGGSGSFIALARDFQDFRHWQSFHIAAAPAVGIVHLAGPRTEYLKAPPPPGAMEFPMGTIIVKEIESSDDLTARIVFAMAKRGGTYNEKGARGWEWFELQNHADGSCGILWRGVGPPSGVCAYGDGDNGGCNDCHRAGEANDFVNSPSLRLTSFAAPAGDAL